MNRGENTGIPCGRCLPDHGGEFSEFIGCECEQLSEHGRDQRNEQFFDGFLEVEKPSHIRS